jgi:hypothetical protein
MIRVIAAAVGAAALVLVGALLSALRTRRAIATIPGAFRCKIRVDRRAAGLTTRWPRRCSRAAWVHDSLIIVNGWFGPTVRPLGIRFAEGAVERSVERVGLGFGDHPILLSLRLDDDSHAVLAAPASARSVVAGPYLVAQLSAEPVAPRHPDPRDGPHHGKL